MYRIGVILAAALVLVSCSKQEQKPTDLVTFPLRGQVVSIDTAKMRVMIAHEEIPDYMMAMTMPFKVKERELLVGLEEGDSVFCTLAVSRTESWLETISVVAKNESYEALSPEDINMRRLLQPGDPFPDAAFLNQNGKTVRISDFKGKVLALTFIYTRCPLPDFCIRMSNHFAAIQRALKQEPSLNGQWHLISASFDPKFDSPKVLKEYGESYRADFSTWDFVTDPDTNGASLKRIADPLDLTYASDEGLIQHNLRTAIIDKRGNLVKVINGNEWTPSEVVEEIKKLTTAN